MNESYDKVMLNFGAVVEYQQLQEMKFITYLNLHGNTENVSDVVNMGDVFK
jgi:hypothetical protein